MKRSLRMIGPAVFLLCTGCLSQRARMSRLADHQIACVEDLLRRDPKGNAPRARAAYTNFLHRLPPHESLDPVRARILMKRGEAYLIEGRKQKAQEDFARARALGPSRPDGLPVRVRSAEEVARRLESGRALPPPPAPEFLPPVRRGKRRVCRVVETLCLWGALPEAAVIKRDSTHVQGSDVDLASDLGAEGPAAMPWFRSALRLSDRVAFGLEVAGGTLEGSHRTETGFAYDGEIFPAGSHVRSRLRHLQTGLFLRPFTVLRRRSTFAVDMGFLYVHFHAELRGETAFKEDTIDAFFPRLGVVYERSLLQGRVRFVLEASAAGFVWQQDAVDLLSIMAGGAALLEYAVLPSLSVRFGVRGQYLRYRLTREGEAKDLQTGFLGPVLGVDLRL